MRFAVLWVDHRAHRGHCNEFLAVAVQQAMPATDLCCRLACAAPALAVCHTVDEHGGSASNET
eukprot:scaffold30919_cov59-Phaeocystis_antarctica.AAC.2